jgi:hypothetical protein
MAIDPLTAPKAISEDAMNDFYQYVMKLKKLDLLLFKNVLLEVKQNPGLDIEQYIGQYIYKSEKEYFNIEENIKKLYKKNNLNYNAEKNPFI